ncbi:unnamed protein product, partial [Mesorhabditis spiculigera]
MIVFWLLALGQAISASHIVDLDNPAAHPDTSVECAKQCASSLRTGLLAALGTHSTPYSSLLAPFHHIFSQNPDPRHSLRKSETTCKSVFHFDSCLSKCGGSTEKDTWQQSISHWTLFCTLIRQSTKAVYEYVTCEGAQMRKAVEQCGQINIYPRSSFTTFCRVFEKYRRCYQKVKHDCTPPGLAIKQQIDDAIQKSFERLMNINSNRVRIPNRCTAWINSQGNEEEDENAINQSQWKTSQHRSTDLHVVQQIPVLREAPKEAITPTLEPPTDEPDLITVRPYLPLLSTTPSPSISVSSSLLSKSTSLPSYAFSLFSVFATTLAFLQLRH